MVSKVITRPNRAWVSVAAMVVLLASCGNTQKDATSPNVATTSTVESAPGAPSTSTTTPAATIEIEVANGKVITANKRPTVKRGDEVRLGVRSDVAEEVHVHGYDRSVEVTPGQRAELTFPATIPGIFEIELEHSGKRLIDLEVAG